MLSSISIDLEYIGDDILEYKESFILYDDGGPHTVYASNGNIEMNYSYIFSTYNVNARWKVEVTNLKGGKLTENSLANCDVLILKEVTGIIYLTNRSPINISSNFAKYNKLNFDTVFYEDVKITYENNLIESDNLNISLDKSLASINGNVIINNNYMESYADNVELDLLNRDIIINMFDKEDNIKINRK